MRSLLFLGLLAQLLFTPTDSFAQRQSKDQRLCIQEVSEGFVQLAKAQRKNLVQCIKDHARGKLANTSIEECVAGDRDGTVAKARRRTLRAERKTCSEAPDFGFGGADVASAQAATAPLALLQELLGRDLDLGVVDAAEDGAGARCQLAVAKRAGKCVEAVLEETRRCQRKVLKSDAGSSSSGLSQGIAACVADDSRGEVARQCSKKMARALRKKCGEQDLDSLVPGCAGEDAATCIGAYSRTRADLASEATGDVPWIRALLFSRTEGFRHASIADAHDVLGGLPDEEAIRVTITENTTTFTDAGLAPYDVLLFVNTTGDVLDDAEQAAMERFIRSGRGFVGVHSAADTEYSWPWYGRLVGAYFRSHPALPVEVEVTTEDPNHPSTDHLPPSFLFTDEIYNFDRNPRIDNHILLTVDEEGFIFSNLPAGPSMGPDHPIAWMKQFEEARMFYTNLGHRPETWYDERFLEHLLEGIRFAAGDVSWSRIVIADAANPLQLAVSDAGDVYYVERSGEVMRWERQTGVTREVLTLAVDLGGESGLLGIALDPSFAANGYVYLYASEPVPEPPPASGPPGENVLLRYTARPDGSLDPATRVELLRVPSTRECCHEGGGLAFAPDGTLFLSTGDNTNPFGDAGGYAPLDERPGRERFDAQRTAPNPFDLRGKILRIHDDGGVPSGNLFPADGSLGRPEIFAMGTRNPFRIAVDPATGRLFWGDVGPDAVADAPRGPRGYDEINFADAPGDYGWPFCIADRQPYADFDFETLIAGPLFDCADTVPAVLAYDYATVSELALGNAFSNPELGFTGRTAIAGAFYRTPTGSAPFALPPPFSDALLMTEWTRDILAAVDVSAGGALRRVDRMTPWEKFRRPVDLGVAPDGALYVLEFGTGFGGDSNDARLSRIEYSAEGDLSPIARIEAVPVAGVANRYRFSGTASRALGAGRQLEDFSWDLDDDGLADGTEPVVEATFDDTGVFPVSLVVIDDRGRESIPAVTSIVIGNTPPAVSIESPADGATVPSGTEITVVASAVDAEDGEVACEDFVWERRLGHNAHSHPIFSPDPGCEFTFDSTLPGHGDGRGLFWAVEVSVRDRGGPNGETPLTGRASVRIEVVDP